MIKHRINKHIINLSLLFATCLSMLVGSSAWILASESNVTKKVDVSNPEAYVKINNSGNPIYYATVEQALNNHVNDTASVYVIPGTTSSPKEIKIEQQCVVGSNVTLNFILDENETITNESEGLTGKDQPSYVGFGSDDYTYKNADGVDVTDYATICTEVTINSLNNGATPTIINNGIINIGGTRRSNSPQSATNHDCVVLIMEENSSINSYGTINNYGFIKESSDYNDSKINVYSGTINQQLVVYDWSSAGSNGGNILYNYNDYSTNGKKTFPFNYFDTIQISPIINFYSGSTHNVMVWLFGTSAGDMYAEGCLIGTNGLFRPVNSAANNQEFISWKCTDTYTDNTITETANTLTPKTHTHFIDIQINGDFNFESFTIPLSYMGQDINVNSSEYFLPLSNFFNLSVKSGSNVNINKPIKMMPGSKVTIENGATVNINNSFIVEDISRFGSSAIYKYTTDESVYKSAEFINEGILTINADFAGYIKTSENGNNTSSKILTGPKFINNTSAFETSGYEGASLGDFDNPLYFAVFDKPKLFPVTDFATADVINESNNVSKTNLEANTLYTYESDNSSYYWRKSTDNLTLDININLPTDEGKSPLPVSYSVDIDLLNNGNVTSYDDQTSSLNDIAIYPGSKITFKKITNYESVKVNNVIYENISEPIIVSNGSINIDIEPIMKVSSAVNFVNTLDKDEEKKNGYYVYDPSYEIKIVSLDGSEQVYSSPTNLTVYNGDTLTILNTQNIESIELNNQDIDTSNFELHIDNNSQIYNFEITPVKVEHTFIDTESIKLYYSLDSGVTWTVVDGNVGNGTEDSLTTRFRVEISYINGNKITDLGDYLEITWTGATALENNSFETSDVTASNREDVDISVTIEDTLTGDYATKSTKIDINNCLLPDTLITMADGSYKQVKDIVSGDEVMVFNHETGQIDTAPIFFNDYDEKAWYDVINLQFSNGQDIGVIYEHGFFDLTLNKYVYITNDNYKDFIGHEFYTNVNNTRGSTTLVNAYIDKQYTEVYSPVSYYHLNYFTEDVLSMPGATEYFVNIFPYDSNLKYDETAKLEYISEYGLYTYDDFKDYVPLEFYNAFPAQYLKIQVEKGIISFDDILRLIDRYKKYFVY